MIWLPSKDELKRILESRRRIDPETGCWLWTGYTSRGHGQFMLSKRHFYAHRASMYVYKDFDLYSLDLVCHVRTCPNAHCFWPEHLYIGSKSTNQEDAVATGSAPRYWGARKKG